MRSVRVVIAAALACGACASEAAPVGRAAPRAPPPVAPARPALEVEATVGALNQHDVERAFNRLERDVLACATEGAERVAALGGDVTVSLRIAPDGTPRSVHLRRTTLGDRATERCILDAAHAQRWPKPVGGSGEAEHTYTIEPAVDAAEWNRKKLQPILREIYKQAAKCRRGGGPYQATLYIRRNGRVAAAGVATPASHREEQADCLAEVFTKFRFGWQRAPYSKVTFTLY